MVNLKLKSMIFCFHKTIPNPNVITNISPCHNQEIAILTDCIHVTAGFSQMSDGFAVYISEGISI